MTETSRSSATFDPFGLHPHHDSFRKEGATTTSSTLDNDDNDDHFIVRPALSAHSQGNSNNNNNAISNDNNNDDDDQEKQVTGRSHSFSSSSSSSSSSSPKEQDPLSIPFNSTFNSDSFDPFGIGTLPEKQQQQQQPQQPQEVTRAKRGTPDEDDNNDNELLSSPPAVSRVTRPTASSKQQQQQQSLSSPLAVVSTSTTTTTTIPKVLLLPPKLLVKLTIYEEVSSLALTLGQGLTSTEGASQVCVEGSIYAQVQCSDATKNAPFLLAMSCPFLDLQPDSVVTVRPNPKFQSLSSTTVSSPTTTTTDNDTNQKNNYSPIIVTIPKQEIGYVPVAYYSIQQQVEHMPILLERKVTVDLKTLSVRIGIQVRTKLSNLGDLQDFTVAVSVPEVVDGKSVQILRGEGVWEDLTRTLQWKLSHLNKGESFLVSAYAKLWSAEEAKQPNSLLFPVLLRCKSSADRISTVDFMAVPTEQYPSSITCNRAHSFRLLHRLT